MERDFLKELGLEKETIDSIMAEHGKSIQNEKDKVTSAEAERDGLKSQLAQRDDDIEALKTDSGTSKSLKTQLETLQDNYETLKKDSEAKLVETRKGAALDLALANAKARNPKAVKALLDNDKLELTDEGLKGLDEQLGALQESDAYLFAQESEKVPKFGFSGNPKAPTGFDGSLKENLKSDSFNLTKFLTEKGESE
ncbi:TPA: phage scaffolding protein [Listeria monocytogenes]|uniref:phage scaffolding protein n=1 Tax=Listeria welshimeri TaxID=1643 RepID=UPI0010E7AFF7|nr:phage scaffolding protein [Listeria welshimeri]EAC8094284.1 scaffolding protein [Listeria monocytogenes]ECC1681742.1 scaffolding protein [Listeria innocua]EAF4183698.1 scaffolding protein [Listeria monocytogenes]EAF5338400.1 scaffolding protein [Listeria monocytogenes]EAF5386875.1 scaffolding protein [Listeria monocytogenes]